MEPSLEWHLLTQFMFLLTHRAPSVVVQSYWPHPGRMNPSLDCPIRGRLLFRYDQHVFHSDNAAVWTQIWSGASVFHEYLVLGVLNTAGDALSRNQMSMFFSRFADPTSPDSTRSYQPPAARLGSHHWIISLSTTQPSNATPPSAPTATLFSHTHTHTHTLTPS